MGERTQALSRIILDAACAIANAIKARALFLCSDSFEDIDLIAPLLEKTDIVLVTRNSELSEEQRPRVKTVLYAPKIELTRTGQIKIGNRAEVKLAQWVPLNQIEHVLSGEDFKLLKPFLQE